MRSVFLGFALAVLGGVMSSQAVIIGWASENVLSGATSARLVYITNGGTPSYTTGPVLQNEGAELATASGDAIDGSYLYEQTTTDDTTRTSGAYYIVLFNSDASQYAVSSTSIAYDDLRLGTGDADPPETFYATAFTGWTPVPEPASGLLLCLGAAVLALRRRKTVR